MGTSREIVVYGTVAERPSPIRLRLRALDGVMSVGRRNRSNMKLVRSRIKDGCVPVFFFQAEDGIRDYKVTGVQTCALPIWLFQLEVAIRDDRRDPSLVQKLMDRLVVRGLVVGQRLDPVRRQVVLGLLHQLGNEIGRASCRERV